MRARPPAPAKTSRPSLGRVVPRTRLFHLLDRGRRRPVVWVCGPPGAGKTTLVASYLDTRSLPHLWYQVDGGDADVATFFYYMGLAAAKAAPRRRTPLPLLTPEYLAGLPTFARRYFRDLYSRLRPPFVVVLDNYQEVPADSSFHEVIREGLGQIPDGGCVVLVSRSNPPPTLARLRASQAMEVLTWDELRLTPQESSRIVRLRTRGRPSNDAVHTLHATTDGWAAGLVLLLERLAAEEPAARVAGAGAPEAIFDYFAGEILERTERDTREVLLATAFLPRSTAPMAEALTGLPQAGHVLADLARKNYFTVRLAGPEPVYQYHPLFRAFLRSQARASFSPARRTEVQRAAASLLEAADQVEDAVELLRAAADWAGLARVVRSRAAALLAQGRARTLEEWLAGLPAEVLDDDPRLVYWLGACRLPVSPAESYGHFERAFERFRARGDRAGTLVALSGAVDAILYEWGDFTRLDRWIAALEQLLRESPAFPSAEIEARVAASMFFSMSFRQPQHPEIGAWADRALSLSRASEDVNVRMLAGYNAAHYYIWLGDLPRADSLVASLREAARSPEASPLARLTGKVIEATCGWLRGAPADCLAAVAEGLELSRTSGVRTRDYLLLGAGVYGSVTAGDLAGADRFLRQMAAAMAEQRLLDVSHYHFVAGWAALLRGDLPDAALHVETALRLAEEAGTPFPVANCHYATAQILCERGEHAKAREHLARLRQIAEAMGSALLRFMWLMGEAQLALDRGEEAAGLATLREALALGRARGFVNFGWWRADVMARLCVAAVAAGIEVEYVQRLVRLRRLVPDTLPVEVEAWPWAVRIATLGPFALLVDGAPVRFAGKAQRKPLALLKALIALGGQGVPEAALAEALWPDAEGDAAHRAFTTTLHRLRRLLRHEAALELRDGRLSLDPRLCWVDAWAFERLVRRAETLWPRAEAGGEAAAEATRLSERALALYRGAFLSAETGEPWATSMRERLRSRFLRHVAELGQRLEQAGARARAVEYYQRGLEVDDCAEEFYRRLMTVYHRQGRRAEALAVFARCRTTLAATLGVEPSPETQALHRAVRDG